MLITSSGKEVSVLLRIQRFISFFTNDPNQLTVQHNTNTGTALELFVRGMKFDIWPLRQIRYNCLYVSSVWEIFYLNFTLFMYCSSHSYFDATYIT